MDNCNMDHVSKEAVDVLRTADERFYIDMIDPLEIGIAHAVEVHDDGVLIYFPDDLWYIMALTEDRAAQLAQVVRKNRKRTEMVCTHQTLGNDVVSDVLGGLTCEKPCVVGTLSRREPFEIDYKNLEFRQASLSDAGDVWHHYTIMKDSPEGFDYAQERIAAGKVWGGYVNGRMIGFIGKHHEETIGMLEVFPEYRRHGYGNILIKSLCNLIMEEGRIPYCHIYEDNEASLNMQRHLGMWLSCDETDNVDSSRRIYWMS